MVGARRRHGLPDADHDADRAEQRRAEGPRAWPAARRRSSGRSAARSASRCSARSSCDRLADSAARPAASAAATRRAAGVDPTMLQQLPAPVREAVMTGLADVDRVRVRVGGRRSRSWCRCWPGSSRRSRCAARSTSRRRPRWPARTAKLRRRGRGGAGQVPDRRPVVSALPQPRGARLASASRALRGPALVGSSWTSEPLEGLDLPRSLRAGRMLSPSGCEQGLRQRCQAAQLDARRRRPGVQSSAAVALRARTCKNEHGTSGDGRNNHRGWNVATPGVGMAADIAEQPEVYARLLEPAHADPIAAVARGIADRRPRHVVFTARGTSDHAALYARLPHRDPARPARRPRLAAARSPSTAPAPTCPTRWSSGSARAAARPT